MGSIDVIGGSDAGSVADRSLHATSPVAIESAARTRETVT
jgi:hypothetical protein